MLHTILSHDMCRLSESDKKIQEIMDGLLFRTAAVTGKSDGQCTTRYLRELYLGFLIC